MEKSEFLDWSSKTGNGSIFSTTEDLYRWDRALYTGEILSKEMVEKMNTNYGSFVGYGCFVKEELNKMRYFMTGRSPGFTSCFTRYPQEDVCIVVLSNSYIPVGTQIGEGLAAILSGDKFEIPTLPEHKPALETVRNVTGRYQFDSSFYRPNFVMTGSEKNGRLITYWGELIPKADNDYVGRTYRSATILKKMKRERSAE